jgi:hypothetical protein
VLTLFAVPLLYLAFMRERKPHPEGSLLRRLLVRTTRVAR